MFIKGRFIDFSGKELPPTLELSYASGHGDAWSEVGPIFWSGASDAPLLPGQVNVLLRRPDRPDTDHDQWPVQIDVDGPPWRVTIGPMLFMPVSFGVYSLELLIDGRQVQQQRLSILRAS